MAHPLVAQLRFTRSEWLRGLESVTADEAAVRFEPLNCISWIVGHLAWQENRYWLLAAQGRDLAPQLDELVGVGRPPSTPSLAEMWQAWYQVTTAADSYLDTLDEELLQSRYVVHGQPHVETIGTMLLRMIYHYWYHIGEAQAVRQLLGHENLPQFVGSINSHAAYRPR